MPLVSIPQTLRPDLFLHAHVPNVCSQDRVYSAIDLICGTLAFYVICLLCAASCFPVLSAHFCPALAIAILACLAKHRLVSTVHAGLPKSPFTADKIQRLC